MSNSQGSPRISADRQEPHYSLRELFDAELGALAIRGADGLLLPDQEWNRRVSPDDVVHHVFKSRLNPAAAAEPSTKCIACERRKAAAPSRFCSKGCRTAFDADDELAALRTVRS